jgi:hypothetical protein
MPTQLSDFPKAIFYLNTHQLVRRACDLCCSVVAPEFRNCLYVYTAVNSEDYKEKVMDLFHEGKELRWVFATIAAGMGMDIPDIELAVIFGTDNFKSVFQKGGHAGRDAAIDATMVWIVEPWAFEVNGHEENHGINNPPRKHLRIPKSAIIWTRLHENTSTEVNRLSACAHTLLLTYVLPGFPWYHPNDDLDWDNECDGQAVIWEVVDQEIATGPDCGCSSLVCGKQASATRPVAIKTICFWKLRENFTNLHITFY